jgi:trk system potassium uptake protein TrkH
MLVGGAAGATVGGIKLIRFYLFWRAGCGRLRKFLLPDDAVVVVRMGEHRLGQRRLNDEVARAAVFCFLYLLVLLGSVVLVASATPPPFTLADVIFECISAQGTVGLSTGITDPGMPVVVELVFILQMWIGRLEIFPVVVLVGSLISRRAGAA